MKKLLAMALLLSVAACAVGADESLKTEEQKVSYMLGHSFGEYLKEIPAEMDVAKVLQGLQDGYKGAEPLLTKEEAAELRQSFALKMQEAQEKMQAAKATENLAEGKAFLEENKLKDKVKVTDSGLQYEVLREGDGPKPAPDDMVNAHYEGRFIDGEVFDSSYERGEPVTFPLDRVIVGWSEGVQLMNVGAKYRLYIPANLGYGEGGPSPNAVLVFDVELLGIENGQQ